VHRGPPSRHLTFILLKAPHRPGLADVAAQAGFYDQDHLHREWREVEAFGFVETLVVPGEGGREIAHAELRWPEGGGIMLGSTSEDSVFSRMKPGMTSIYVVTDTPDALFDRATAAGADVVRELRDEDYGSRGFTVRDPEGNPWSFATYCGAWSLTSNELRS
jgi:uncharacterized glyoxalase superfamily protein PhnB